MWSAKHCRDEEIKTESSQGSGTFTSLTPLSMQDMKLNASATLIDQSMSPYHAGEPRCHRFHLDFLH